MSNWVNCAISYSKDCVSRASRPGQKTPTHISLHCFFPGQTTVNKYSLCWQCAVDVLVETLRSSSQQNHSNLQRAKKKNNCRLPCDFTKTQKQNKIIHKQQPQPVILRSCVHAHVRIYFTAVCQRLPGAAAEGKYIACLIPPPRGKIAHFTSWMHALHFIYLCTRLLQH